MKPQPLVLAVLPLLLASACSLLDSTSSSTAALCRTQTLVAERRYNPNLWLDARVTLAEPLHFALPASLPVTRGNSGNHAAYLRFGPSATGPLVTCTYRGIGSGPAPTTPAEIAAANRYDFASCDDGSAAGAVVTASHVRLRVSSGGDFIFANGRTVVTVDIGEPEVEFFLDDDADGFGDPATRVTACSAPARHITTAGDCDDSDDDVHPGAAEACNGRDDNCDGAVDDDAAEAPEWYRDRDGDRFGDGTAPRTACAQPTGFVDDDNDCNDGDASIHPGAPDPTDGQDRDCDGSDT